jgi:hypothetical protein
MYNVTLHIKTKAGGLIPQPRILLAYDNGRNGGAYRRMLDHRRVDVQHVCSRPVDETEYHESAHPFRIGFVAYDNWDALLEDERKFDVPEAWTARLLQLKEQYPQFTTKIP